jgi:protein disulfide-isomerase
MRRLVGLTIVAIALALPAPHAWAALRGDGTAVTGPQIAWREGDVEDAFAEAKEVNKPVLLYWGAKWCPPCNLMKQTLFKDPAFIAETTNFIPVHLDGDAKDAQIWGQKFGIRGYPTVIVLLPDRTEVTRLDGGATASALTDVLKLAAKRTISTEELLKRAESPASLSADDWHLLASFDWTDDPKHFGDLKAGAAFVARLGDAAPDPAVKRQFTLTSLLMENDNADVAKLSPDEQAKLRVILPAILANYDEVKANRQELSGGAASLILGLPDPAERRALSKKLVSALDRLAADDSVPLDDRLSTVGAEVALAKAANGGKVAPGLMAKVRERVAMADKAATDPSMRQAVMPDAGELLADAGDKAGAEKLWEAELPRAVAPYYYMLDLAHLAEAGKDNKAAIGWLKQAAEAAQGPATRIQWAILYSNGVIRMAADDKAAVAAAAGMVIDALGRNNSGYAERTEKKVDTWSQKLREWAAAHDGADVLTQLSAKLDQACVKDGCKNGLKT